MNIAPGVLLALPTNEKFDPDAMEDWQTWSDATGIGVVVSHVWPHSERDKRVFNGWVAVTINSLMDGRPEYLLDFEVQMWENGDITMPRDRDSKRAMVWVRKQPLRYLIKAAIGDHLRAVKAGKPEGRLVRFTGRKYPPHIAIHDSEWRATEGRPALTGVDGRPNFNIHHDPDPADDVRPDWLD